MSRVKMSIRDVWRLVGLPCGSFGAWQKHCLAAHRAGKLKLARLDYSGGLTKAQLEDLEEGAITDGHATYHVVVLEIAGLWS